jgi:hypothetical protein
MGCFISCCQADDTIEELTVVEPVYPNRVLQIMHSKLPIPELARKYSTWNV